MFNLLFYHNYSQKGHREITWTVYKHHLVLDDIVNCTGWTRSGTCIGRGAALSIKLCVFQSMGDENESMKVQWLTTCNSLSPFSNVWLLRAFKPHFFLLHSAAYTDKLLRKLRFSFLWCHWEHQIPNYPKIPNSSPLFGLSNHFQTCLGATLLSSQSVTM